MAIARTLAASLRPNLIFASFSQPSICRAASASTASRPFNVLRNGAGSSTCASHA